MLNLAILTYLLLPFLVLFESKRDARISYNYMAALFMYVVICIIAFLKPIGLGYDDYNYYAPISDENHPYLKDWEYGFITLYSLLRYINLTDFSCFSAAVVGISMFNNIKVFSYFSPYLSLSIFFYLCHFFLYKELTQVRFAIASSFCFLSFYYLYKKNYKSYVVAVCIATLFHVSALVALLSFLVVRIRLKSLFWLILLSIFLSLFGFLDQVIILLGEGLLNEKAFATYIEVGSVFSASLGLLNIITIKYLLISIFSIYMCMHKVVDRKFVFLTKIYCLAPLWIIIFSSFGTLAGRPAAIFSVVECILLAYFCCSKYNSNTLFYKTVIISISIFILYVNVFVKKMINLEVLL
jgi:hypothetical protein